MSRDTAPRDASTRDASSRIDDPAGHSGHGIPLPGHNGARSGADHGTQTAAVIVGAVEHGNEWGRVLGFPTANLPLDDAEFDGVWAGTVTIDDDPSGAVYLTAVSVGTRPTYYTDGIRLLEAHFLDFEGDLYGKTIRVRLEKYLRGQVGYSGSEALIEQLAVDVQGVREWAAARG